MQGTAALGSRTGKPQQRAPRTAELESRDDRLGRFALQGLLAVWIFAPELRRLIDWKHGFSSISVVSVLPIVALLPFLLAVRASKHAASQAPVGAIAVLWAGIFAYALVFGIAAGNAAAALYAFTLAVLPAAAGVWLGGRRANAAVCYSDFARFILWSAAIVSIYGIYQFVAAPPWDTAWMRNADMNSIGSPMPYMIRVFSVLNAPAALGDYLVLALLIAFPILSWRSAPLVTVILAALALSQLREAWVGLALGLVVLLLLSPRRIGGALAIAGSVAACALALSYLPYVTGTTDVQNTILTRINTFARLDSDLSAVNRREQMDLAYREALINPLGTGLGKLGTAAKLNGAAGSTEVLDSGILSRFVEMGILGTLAYLGVLFVSIVIAFRIWWVERGPDRSAARTVAAVALAVQIMLLAGDFFGDKHLALDGLLFWIVLGLMRNPRAVHR